MRRTLLTLTFLAVSLVACGDPDDDANAAVAAAVTKNCTAIQHRGAWRGTENQPIGVEKAAPYGPVEIDAHVTKDGKVVALHDFNLRRLTGGDSNLNVNEVTWEQLRSFDHPYGEFRRTSRLIQEAGQHDVAILVNINKWGIYGSTPDGPMMLDHLYAAAQQHPHPNKVYFSGMNGEMRDRHKDTSVFARYEASQTKPEILDHIKANNINIAAFGNFHWDAPFIKQVRDTTDARPASRQVSDAAEAREAQSVGINMIQGNGAKRIATEWCLP